MNELPIYKGTTDFRSKQINAIFTDKTLNLNVGSSRVDERFDDHFVSVKDWFAFDALYGTSEEREPGGIPRPMD